MAMSDRKRDRRRIGGGGDINWDAVYRAESKAKYDWLIRHDDITAIFDAMGDDEFLRIIRVIDGISRYGCTDYERLLGQLDESGRRAVKERIERIEQSRQSAMQERHAEDRAKRVARQTVVADAYRQTAELTAGMLRSDIHDVVRIQEKYGRWEGDWLDDPVAAVTGGPCYGEYNYEHAGIVLQVTLSLDGSSSMWVNGVASDACRVFMEMGLALDELREEFSGSFYASQFVFALGREGKNVYILSDYAKWYGATNEGPRLGKYEAVRSWANWEPNSSGEDTWIAPLLDQLEKWEDAESDPGAVRLDLIVTDAVLEHPTDVRAASVIQDRRDGALQTVLLNLLPEDEWLNSALPKHCVQYPVTVDNVAGQLRNILAEFVSVFL